MQTKQNQVLLDWYCYSKQFNPMNDKKKKLFLIPYEWSEPDVAFVACFRYQQYVPWQLYQFVGLAVLDGQKCPDSICSSQKSPQHKNASIEPELVCNLQESFDRLRELADVTATCTFKDLTRKVTLCDNDYNKVYIPSWITKRGAHQQYCHE
mgnify:CR=1 FL=1